MPNTTSFDFADFVLVPFLSPIRPRPKKRPAVIVSSAEYHEQRRDLILMAITSHFRPVTTVGEVIVQHWQQAGLIKPSVLEPLLATVEKSLVLRAMGKLQGDDRVALRKSLDEILDTP